MRIIAIANQKGGCGKTTTSVSLAWSFAIRGRRTLLVDLDPQAHSTMSLGVNPERLELHMADVLLGTVFDENAIRITRVLQNVRDNLWLAPAGVELSAIEHNLASVDGREERLTEHLAGIDPDYDVALVDCPPSLGLLTMNALIAASEAIVPVDCSPLALHGIGRLKETARLIHEMTGHTVRLRPLVTLYDPRTRVSKETVELLRNEFGDDAIPSPIRYTVRLREKIGKGRIRSALTASGAAAQDYGAVAGHLLSEEGVAPPPERASVPILVAVPGGIMMTYEGDSPEEVLLAGDFNGWVPDAGVRMEEEGPGRWRKFIPAPSGAHQYKLVLRGQWVTDPRNPRGVPNEFGSTNSVIEVS